MDIERGLLNKLEESGFKVSTDTRKDMTGSVYFPLKGDNFDGNMFIYEALQKGAIAAVTDDKNISGDNIFLVEDSLKTLHSVARYYREKFAIPFIAIGGSNGKTTSRELLKEVLGTKYKVHASEENLNNHFGVPLSILAMKRGTEIGIFEIGANHAGEHLALLDTLRPTHVVVTNNGLDHLEGFGSPEGVRKANKEIYDWAREYGAVAFVHKRMPDLMEDSEGLERVVYPEKEYSVSGSIPLELVFDGKEFPTKLVGDYNISNIELAVAVGNSFGVSTEEALKAVCIYEPSLKRSQFVNMGDIRLVLDCYNANPSSMALALESFFRSAQSPRGVVLGDMLELGTYAEEEHKKIVEYVFMQKPKLALFVGENFKRALAGTDTPHHWFANSEEAKKWLKERDFSGFTFLLKGSRGLRIEKAFSL